MGKFKILGITLALLVLQCSCGNSNSGAKKQYLLDPQIITDVNKALKQFDSSANASIFYKMYENEKVISENFTSNSPVPGISFTEIIDSVIAIDCLNGIDEGIGYSLIISKDTAFVRLQLVSKDSFIFSNNLQSLPEPHLFVPSTTSKIILSRDPEFSAEEIIQGYLELTSDYFYEHTNNGVRKLKIQLRSHFQSEPKSTMFNYKTLKRK